MSCPVKCEHCLQSGKCDGCQDNSSHGDFCNDTCRAGCMGKCHQNGTCIDCQGGVYGNYCDLNCTSCYINTTCSCSRNDGGCLCGCQDKGFYGKFCNVTCSNINKNCMQCKGNVEDGICMTCNVSHFGNFCDNECPENCLKCESNQLCTECKPGHSGETCLDTCKNDQCIRCDKHGDCLECSPGLKGTNCDEKCKDVCETCEAVGNNCLSCVNDHFIIKGQCVSCSKHCLECTNKENCTLCKEGFYGNTCSKCPSHCETCVNDTFCNTCTSSWSGVRCLCSENCKKGGEPQNVLSWCNESDGHCLKGCKDGFFTATCSEQCTDNCENCTQDDGVCEKCSGGKYGLNCDEVCGNCMQGVCHMFTGECPGECESGFYGKFCNMTCNSNCSNGICEKVSGNCSSCLHGFFGGHCNLRCYKNCDGTCEQYTGTCNGCQENRYFGPNCTRDCENCKGCNQTGYCLSCKEEFYGDHCNISCPVTCGPEQLANHNSTECGRYDGRCKACRPGFFNYNCTEKCGDECYRGKGHICQISDGACVECKPGYYGSHCQKKCSLNCAKYDDRSELSGLCLQQNGACEWGCVHGWYGASCSLQCNSTCKGCDRLTAKCETCIEGYYGDYCETSKFYFYITHAHIFTGENCN